MLVARCNFRSLILDAFVLQAIAIVLGFLVVVGLIILLVFAVKTRSLIQRWGQDRILWEEVKIINSPPHNSVGEWVSRNGNEFVNLKTDHFT